MNYASKAIVALGQRWQNFVNIYVNLGQITVNPGPKIHEIKSFIHSHSFTAI